MEGIATHNLSTILGTLVILRLALGLLSTLQSVFGLSKPSLLHKESVLCKPGADQQQRWTCI